MLVAGIQRVKAFEPHGSGESTDARSALRFIRMSINWRSMPLIVLYWRDIVVTACRHNV
jgi:hypothetical protein